MIPLNADALKMLAANKVARWLGAIAGAALCLWLARCQGASSARADEKQKAADALATAANDSAKASARIADSIKGIFADSMKDLRVAKAKADVDAAHALAHLGTVTVIHRDTPAPRGETPISGDGQLEPDTTKYARIQRQGDPRLYDVPQFVVDLGAELRRALTEKADEAAKAERNLAIVRSAMHADSNTIRDLRAAADARAKAESIAKSNAGQNCRIMPFVPCLPRWLTFTVGAGAGGAAGYEIGKAIATRK